MKLRIHKTVNLDNQRKLQQGPLAVLAEGILKQRQAVYGRHARPLDAKAVCYTVAAFPWAAVAANRSPKRLARFKHALTVRALEAA